MLRKIWLFSEGAWSFEIINHRPAVCRPCYSVKRRLTAEKTVFTLDLPAAQVRDEPFSVRCFYRLAVSTALYACLWVGLSHYRVERAWLIYPEQAAASRHDYAVAFPGATFGLKKIVPTVLFQKV